MGRARRRAGAHGFASRLGVTKSVSCAFPAASSCQLPANSSGASAAGVLIAVDLPNPGNYSAEGDRVLYTLIGVAIAVIVMLLGNLLAKRTAEARPQAAPHPA